MWEISEVTRLLTRVDTNSFVVAHTLLEGNSDFFCDFGGDLIWLTKFKSQFSELAHDIDKDAVILKVDEGLWMHIDNHRALMILVSFLALALKLLEVNSLPTFIKIVYS